MAACWAPTTSSSWGWDNSGSALFMGDGMAAAAAAAAANSSTSSRNAGNLTAIDPSSGIGLKLGKRIYFEDGSPPTMSAKTEMAAVSVAAPATSPAKKRQRGPAQPAAPPSCQVDGCAADLSGSKGYHRRHRVCELHAKAPRSSVKGVEQRFCQQCSRFHGLSYFDEGKRSCRRRLAGHNQRRRKPPPPDPFAMGSAIVGGSAGLFSPAGNYMHHSSLALAANAPPRHLLDGSFIVGKDNWPGSSCSSPRFAQIAGYGQANLMLKSKQEMIASHGVYQFLKCHAAAIGAAPTSSSIASHPDVPGKPSMAAPPLEPQAGMISQDPASSDALSLLSPPDQQQWGSCSSLSSSPSSLMSNKPMKIDDPSFQLQLYDRHHHPQQQQQQQHPQQHQQRSSSFMGGISELFQFQKPCQSFNA